MTKLRPIVHVPVLPGVEYDPCRRHQYPQETMAATRHQMLANRVADKQQRIVREVEIALFFEPSSCRKPPGVMLRLRKSGCFKPIHRTTSQSSKRLSSHLQAEIAWQTRKSCPFRLRKPPSIRDSEIWAREADSGHQSPDK